MIRHIGFCFCSFSLAMSLQAPLTEDTPVPGSLGRCSSSCHGVNQGQVQITGFPD
ncbi:MAG: hypothetical protein IPP40_17585 [bacterium]|nr:hypothetical protein [bacterium]